STPTKHDRSRATNAAQEPAVTNQEPGHKGGATNLDEVRHAMSDIDVYEHPYVIRLERQIEKWEGKYHDQVRRTEEIQIQSQEKLLELQRMTAIGQNKTLADFMLKAREMLGLGSGADIKSGEVNDSASA